MSFVSDNLMIIASHHLMDALHRLTAPHSTCVILVREPPPDRSFHSRYPRLLGPPPSHLVAQCPCRSMQEHMIMRDSTTRASRQASKVQVP